MFDETLAAARRFFTGMFFYPDTDDLGTPADEGLAYEDVRFPSGDAQLHGFLIRAQKPARGVVLHCHGNAGNVTVHFPQVAFLARAGYDVLVFDYAGFGRSAGRPSLPGIENDAKAALAYLLGRTDLATDRVAIFGQSLGGAAAAAAASHPAVRCLVLEATFTTYREIAWSTLTGRALFFLVPTVIPEGGPATYLPAFAPRPILFVHGEADVVVPVRFSRRLYKLFRSHSRLWTARHVTHLPTSTEQTPPFSGPILEFLEAHLGGKNPSP